MPDGRIDLFQGRSVRWLIEDRCQRYPDKECLVWRDLDGSRLTWTYSQFLDAVDEFAGGLQSRGVGVGQAVCIHAHNCPQYLIAWFAIQSIGAWMVTTNARSTAPELRGYLQRTSSVAVITQANLLDVVREAADGVDSVQRIVVVGDPSHTDWVSVPVESFGSVSASHVDIPDIDSQQWAGVQFTSGTTASPKGVVWTHSNYLWGAKISAAHEGLVHDDRHLTFLPLFHTNAQVYSVMASLWVGATVVLVPRFSAQRFWPVSLEEEATWGVQIPFSTKALRGLPKPDHHHFRGWGNGLVVPGWDRDFSVATTAWWGMTETVTHGIVSDPGIAPRPLAVGVAAPEYELRLVQEDGAIVEGPGEGLLEIRGIRGVSMALGYLDDPAADDAAWAPDGWFRTGDRLELHPDGWFTFVSRDKDMLKVGGENVAALEIERVIGMVPGVDEVAVVGGPDRLLDEVPVAFVISTAPDDSLLEQILAACGEHLADFKRPRAVFFVDELPRSTLEKVAKNVLVTKAATLLGDEKAYEKKTRTQS
jgi:carnitine-CoA ligase